MIQHWDQIRAYLCHFTVLALGSHIIMDISYHFDEVRAHRLLQLVSYVSCRFQVYHYKYFLITFNNTGMSCQPLSRWEICHMWDEMHREVVHTGKL